MKIPAEPEDVVTIDELSMCTQIPEPGDNYDRQHFVSVDFDYCDAQGARFIECAIADVSVVEGQFRRSTARQVWMKNVRIVGGDFSGASWSRCVITGSSLAGVEFHSSKLDSVTFSDCKLDSVNFRTVNLHNLVFDNCTLTNVDFDSATLSAVTFPDSRLRDVTLTKSVLKQVDFRGADEVHFASGYDCLSGAIIDSMQLIAHAPMLAAALGITVSDE